MGDAWTPRDIDGAFWTIIRKSAKDRKKLAALLETMERDDILEFHREFFDAGKFLSQPPYLDHMAPGTSEDGADDVSRWVVAQGKEYCLDVCRPPGEDAEGRAAALAGAPVLRDLEGVLQALQRRDHGHARRLGDRAVFRERVKNRATVSGRGEAVRRRSRQRRRTARSGRQRRSILSRALRQNPPASRVDRAGIVVRVPHLHAAALPAYLPGADSLAPHFSQLKRIVSSRGAFESS